MIVSLFYNFVLIFIEIFNDLLLTGEKSFQIFETFL